MGLQIRRDPMEYWAMANMTLNEKNPAAVALVRLGGLKGGKAHAVLQHWVISDSLARMAIGSLGIAMVWQSFRRTKTKYQ